MSRIVILGGGYAGLIAAQRLERRHQVTLVNGSASFVQRIRLHQDAAGQPAKRYPIPRLLRGTGVDFVQGWATALDADAHTLSVVTSDGPITLGYDVLLYAVGSTTQVQSVPGADEYAYRLDATGPMSALALAERSRELAARNGTLAIVGSGLTGIEAATEFAETYPHLHVVMVTAETLGERLSGAAQRYLRARFAKLGIELVEKTVVSRVERDMLVTEDGERIAFDACLWAGSFVAPPLAREAGLRVDERGRMIADPFLRSVSHPDIYGAGDAVAVREASGVPIRMACATAMPIGAHVADNINARLKGKAQRPFGFNYFIQCISLGRRDGLIQRVDGFDRPSERIITGRAGAFIKEMICRYTVASIGYERRLPGLYRWPGRVTDTKQVRLLEDLTQHG